MSLRAWWPRRAPGLPPGQRLLTEMPRFSDDPMRPPPPTPEAPTLEVRIEGRVLASTAVSALAAHPSARAQVHDFHCVTGWSVHGLRWRGPPLCALLAELLGTLDLARLPPFAVAVAHDGVAATFCIEDLLDERTLLATHLDGAPLDARHGAPLRLVAPHLYGYKNIKHLRAVQFVTDAPPSRFGPKEHPRARVAEEERHSTLPNWLVRVPYRLVVPPTAHLAERALSRQSH